MGPLDHHADPHMSERCAIVTLQHPEVGDEHHVRNPIRMRLAQRTAHERTVPRRRYRQGVASVVGSERRRDRVARRNGRVSMTAVERVERGMA